MLESFLCFCLSPSRKGILGCAAGEGEKVYSRAMGKGFGTLCAKKSPYSSSTGLHLAATNLQQAVPCSHPFLTPQSIPGDHHGHRELQGDSRLPLLCAALILLAKPSMQHPPEGAGVGSSDTRCSSGWGGRGCLKEMFMGQGNCDMPDESGDSFQPAWADLELLPQVELPFLREQPQPPGDGRKFRLFCILLGQGGAGQVSALGIQSPWQHRGRGWPSFFLQG